MTGRGEKNKTRGDCSSDVNTTLRVLAGNDEELLHMIPVLLEDKYNAEGNFIETAVVPEVMELLKETEFSHLVEMKMIWEELGPNMEGLFQMGRSGVVASLIAACERLHINEHKCCQVLAKTVCSADESPKWIVPRLLFLDSYFTCEDRSNWTWQTGAKMHVILLNSVKHEKQILVIIEVLD
ncbi:pumilio-family RNA-binding repeatprotein [Sesbania bispinosa]|nr:pumilio-family RNA-binding repeatprotein [Sesbania bispinosa]